jgi:hypothetical protein
VAEQQPTLVFDEPLLFEPPLLFEEQQLPTLIASL